MREFYGDGARSCALDTLSMPAGSKALHQALREALTMWIDAFGCVSFESGCSAAEARRLAETAIVEIEGSLACSRVLGDGALFERTMKRLPELLLKP